MGCAASKPPATVTITDPKAAEDPKLGKPVRTSEDRDDDIKTDVTLEASVPIVEGRASDEGQKADVSTVATPAAAAPVVSAPAAAAPAKKPSFLTRAFSKKKTNVVTEDAEEDADAIAKQVADAAVEKALAAASWKEQRLEDAHYKGLGMVQVGPGLWEQPGVTTLEEVPVTIAQEEEEHPVLKLFASVSKSLSDLWMGMSTALVAVEAPPSEPTLTNPPLEGAAATAAAAAFHKMDKNGDGVLSRIEVVKALRSDPAIRELLNLPAHIRQEDGSRDQFEAVFQRMDADGSKGITEDEFCRVLNPEALAALGSTLETAAIDGAAPVLGAGLAILTATPPNLAAASSAPKAPVSVEPTCTPPTVEKIFSPVTYP